MPKFNFQGISVDFPYTLYEPQRKYVEQLIEALKTGKNALLESPTGTGKTLCLLCGALAWQRAIVDGETPSPSQIPKERPSNWGFDDDEPDNTALTLLKPSPPLSTKSASAWDSLEAFESSSTSFRSTSSKGTYFHPSPVIPSKTAFTDNRNGSKIEASSSIAESIPTIFFASRTHSQLTQVIDELKKTAYVSASSFTNVQVTQSSDSNFDFFSRSQQPTSSNQADSEMASLFRFKVTVLASRDHLCVHPDLTNLRGSALNSACRQKLKIHSCHFEGGLSRFKSDCLTVPRDIEELRMYGRHAGFCPYYAAKDSHPQCHLVLLPYDYLLSPVMRKTLKFRLRNSVIIFDEGHNIEGAAEDCGSFDLKRSILNLTIEALQEYRGNLLTGRIEKEKMLGFTTEQLEQKMETPLINLMKYINNVPLLPPDSDHSTSYQILPAGNLLSIFADCGFSRKDLPLYDTMLSKCADWIGSPSIEQSGSLIAQVLHRGGGDAVAAARKAKAVTDILEALTVTFSPFVQSQSRWFRIYIHEEQAYRKPTQVKQRRVSLGTSNDDYSQTERILSFWCFSAGAVLMHLCYEEKVHSLIVTSGTLSPLDSYGQALGGYGDLKYPIQFSNDHVIKQEQISLQILTHYQKGQPLCFVYNNRKDVQMVQSAGSAVCEIIRKVPGGVLVFFSSYLQMDTMLQTWKRLNDWTLLEQTKTIFQEPNSPQPAEFEQFIEGFKTSVRKEIIKTVSGGYSGAVLFAVTRGRISEGMNLADDLCRCVIVVGVPHPMLKDPRLQLKQRVLDEAFPNGGKGKQWYLQQAGRAVNQAIGRVIRHIDDFGLVVLVDQRFDYGQQFNQLSKWIRPAANRQPQRSYLDIVNQIDAFFRHHYKEALPTSNGPPKVSKERRELLNACRKPTVETQQKERSFESSSSAEIIGVRKSRQPRTGSKGIGRTVRKQAVAKEVVGDSKRVIRQTTMNQFLATSSSCLLARKSFSSSAASKSSVRPTPFQTTTASTPKISDAFRKELSNSNASTPQRQNTQTDDQPCGGEMKLCQICQSSVPSSEIQKSRACNHSACRECWRRQFENKFECPFCRRKTRKEHLTAVPP